MRYGWNDFAIITIGGVIGYFAFSGFYEESFVLWRAQKMERLLIKIDAFSEEKAAYREQLVDIDREKGMYNEKLSAVRDKCTDLRAEIDKLMKSRRDMTKLKELLKAKQQQAGPGGRGGSIRNDTSKLAKMVDKQLSKQSLSMMDTAVANSFREQERKEEAAKKQGKDESSSSGTDKSGLILMRNNIASAIEQLGAGIRGPHKAQFKQMLRNSRDEILARKRTWRIDQEIEAVENQLRTEAWFSELKRLRLSEDPNDDEDDRNTDDQEGIGADDDGSDVDGDALGTDVVSTRMALILAAEDGTSMSLKDNPSSGYTFPD